MFHTNQGNPHAWEEMEGLTPALTRCLGLSAMGLLALSGNRSWKGLRRLLNPTPLTYRLGNRPREKQ